MRSILLRFPTSPRTASIVCECSCRTSTDGTMMVFMPSALARHPKSTSSQYALPNAGEKPPSLVNTSRRQTKNAPHSAVSFAVPASTDCSADRSSTGIPGIARSQGNPREIHISCTFSTRLSGAAYTSGIAANASGVASSAASNGANGSPSSTMSLFTNAMYSPFAAEAPRLQLLPNPTFAAPVTMRTNGNSR